MPTRGSYYTTFANKFVDDQLCPTCGRELPTPEKFGIRMAPKGLHYKDEFVPLTFYQLKIVGLLFRAYPGLVTKDRMIESVWGGVPNPPEPKTLDIHLMQIRRKLGKTGLRIQTWWGRGYSLWVPDSMIAVAKAMRQVSDLEKFKTLQDREVMK